MALIDADWLKPDGAVRLNGDLGPTDLKSFPRLAGHGGFGMETSPALGRIAAALALGEAFAAGAAPMDVTADDFHPARLAAK